MALKLDLLKLDDMTIAELKELKQAAETMLSRKANEEMAKLQKQMDELNALVGTSAPVKTSRQRNPSSYTHVHPKNSHEWLGRGGVPEQWRDIVSPDDAPEVRKQKIAPYKVER